MKVLHALLSFNRGLVSRLALARIDLKRLALAAETFANWMPRTLGSMMLRPGLGYLGATRSNASSLSIPFVFSVSDTALIELTNLAMRVRVSDSVITRGSVSSAITNSTFSQYTDTVTMTIASPAVITYAGADNFAVNDPVTFTTTGALPTGIVAGTTYYVKTVNSGTNAITIAATAGGAAINTSGAQSGVHTMQAYYHLAGWTDSDESGAISAWYAGGYLSLIGTGTNSAMRDQQVTVAVADQNDEHALAININRGEVTLRIGSSSGGEQYIAATTLRAGYHSIAFTPTGDFHIRLSNVADTAALVDSIAVEAVGDMALTTPWPAAALSEVRFDQSGDVIFCACRGYVQMRIERHATRSWSVVKYAPSDGPFRADNAESIRISAAAISGDTTLTASKDLFAATHVGALFRLTSAGQTVSSTLTAEDTFTNPIRVTGTGSGRNFSSELTAAPTFSGTTSLTLQRSIAEPGDWVDVSAYTTVGVRTHNDALDNQVVYYRIGIKTGDYTALDGVLSQLIFSAGSITGIARVTGYTSPTSVSAAVLSDLGGTASTANWAEGAWSAKRGYPTSVVLHDGRLWWAGKDKINGSVSDAFSSFDDEIEGDSGPISRSIGAGPVDTINWLVSAANLMVGGQGSEYVARASSLDEPLTPTQFGLKSVSTLGSAALRAIKVDNSVVFVQRNGTRAYEISLDSGSYNYVSSDLTALVPEIGSPSIVRIAVQRMPDTRIHCVRSDGLVAVLVFDKVENVSCWLLVETDGDIEDVAVLPGSEEDSVYYTVKRTINSATVRFIEKWALESECVGGTTNRQADAFVSFTNGPASATITGLSHLEGESVVVWADGKCLADAAGEIATFTVASGQIAATDGGSTYLATTGIVGLPYTAQFKSAKLALASQAGVPLTQKKRIDHLGLVLADTHAQGLRYGQDFDNLDGLPQTEDWTTVDPDLIWEEYDADAFELNGEWSTDARLCLEASAPRPCTVLAAVIGVSGHDKA
jgi:hypothetical protein